MMMKNLTKYVLPLVVLMAGFAPNVGLGAMIGDPAAPLVVKEWVKGQPVAVKPGTNIYVVEIWNTASLASSNAIAILNDIQGRFKTQGVLVVGISDEPAEKITEFVQLNGTKIDYAIAADDRRQTAESYMKPVGRRGFPYAFVVGTNGNLLWHGTPQRGLDKVLDQIIAGRYDLERAKKMELAWHQMDQYLTLARRGDERTPMSGRVLLAARTNDVMLLCDLAFQISTVPKLAKRDFILAAEALDQADKLATTNTARVVFTRAIMLFESGKQTEGLALAKQTFASAQSPTDKIRFQAIISTMEKRKNEEEKTGGPAPVMTNAPLKQVSTSSNAVINPNP